MSTNQDELEVKEIRHRDLFSLRNIIEKDIAFIRKSIDFLDTTDPSTEWQKKCFCQHAQIHLEVLHDYHFGEQQMKMYYQAQQEDNMFLSADQKIIIIYMETLRKLQSLLSTSDTTESQDEETLKTMETLKEILTEYEEFLQIESPKVVPSEPIEPIASKCLSKTLSNTTPPPSPSKISSHSLFRHVNNTHPSVPNTPDHTMWKGYHHNSMSMSASKDPHSAVLKVLSSEELSPTATKRRSKRELCVEVSMSESVENQENSHHLRANSVNNMSPHVNNISRSASSTGTTPTHKLSQVSRLFSLRSPDSEATKRRFMHSLTHTVGAVFSPNNKNGHSMDAFHPFTGGSLI
mmetsp:Transcript_14854/g.20358  ORF Transcript_14854/g.20358 Transcript_14854/m.20358 type:complete len:349 (+) Transcript_14854:69-1115(+)|eukprot:CAMPEP_0170081724 /NCGR_PEP_ID=MMETSP0019_2-20121128/17511_1 /TAXON_ID=98059 /ORGANISM="Dinobryon sp., Strain UTEXLB2267" /LENGTH=348 /DNA_ID=CAMNT_0010296279 /DNA_START=51 /DNA_END=1097 /DNA_ORIENTATION=-